MVAQDLERRGPGNFDSYEALHALDEWVDELLAEIEDILASGDEADPERQGEGRLMPAIALVLCTCECSGEVPVEPEDVRRWRAQYLARFQARGRALFVDEAGFEARLSVVIDTFARLEELCCRRHPDLAAENPPESRN